MSTQVLSPPDKIKPNSTYYSKYCCYSFLFLFITIFIIFYMWDSNNNTTQTDAATTTITNAYLRIHNWLRQQQRRIIDNNQTNIATTLRQYTNTTISYKTGASNFNFDSINSHKQPLTQNIPTVIKDIYSPDDMKLIDMARELLHRSEVTLDWITSSEDKVDTVIRWDLISNSEVHILNKLVTYLKVIANINDKDSYRHIIDLARKGHQCTPIQALQQAQISRFISMDICSEIEWYKVAQLAWPEATNFIDIGANKGYLGALFVSLWGGGDIGISPIEIYNIAKRLNVWSTSRNQGGYCQDGYNYGVSLTCPSSGDTKDSNTRVGGDGNVDNKIDLDVIRDKQTGQCKVANSAIRITSIDGSSYLAQTLNNIIRHEIPINNHNIKLVNGELWQYLNYAVSDEVGVAKFTKQDKDHNPGFEGGGMVTKSLPTVMTMKSKRSSWIEEVNMTTVDHFLSTQRSQSKIDDTDVIMIDILKIDTEGDDNKVLLGARKAITEDLVGMFTFEGGKGVIFSRSMIEGYDKLGYSCYSTSRAGLFKWNAGCMLDKFMGGFRAKDKGNIFCVNRVKAPMVALAYDILSFPLLIESFNISSYSSSRSSGESGDGDGKEDGSGSSSDEKKKHKKQKKQKERGDNGGNKMIDIDRRYRRKDKKHDRKSRIFERSFHEEEKEERDHSKGKDRDEGVNEGGDRKKNSEEDGVVTSKNKLLHLLTTNITYITPEMLVPIYLNIKPFCKPWPMCARVQMTQEKKKKSKRDADGFWDN
jgi:FkbM family methyltransferase